MLKLEEVVERTGRRLRQAVAGGAVEIEPQVSELYIGFFNRAVKVLQGHGCKEGLLQLFAMLLADFECAEQLLQDYGFSWEGEIKEEKAREVLQAEMGACFPLCSKRKKCPVAALIDVLPDIEGDTADIMNLVAKVWCLFRGMLEDYMEGGPGAVVMFSEPRDHRGGLVH